MKNCTLLASKNRFSQLIYLEMLSLFCSVHFTDDAKRLPKDGLLVYDADCFSPKSEGRTLIGYTKDASLLSDHTLLLRPFSFERFRALLEKYGKEGTEKEPPMPSLSPGAPHLTKTEETLLSLLLEAKGAVVDKDTLAKALFPDAEDAKGSVTVYIHYLRKKLETNGKRLIFSHRGKGYSIPPR